MDSVAVHPVEFVELQLERAIGAGQELVVAGEVPVSLGSGGIGLARLDHVHLVAERGGGLARVLCPAEEVGLVLARVRVLEGVRG